MAPEPGENLNTAKARAKLIKALDYVMAINEGTDSRSEKWVINESLLASLTGCFRGRDQALYGRAPPAH